MSRAAATVAGRAAARHDHTMVWHKLAENRIREAIEHGEFSNLPNAGRPLDLEEYFRTPEHLRMAYSVLKSANCLPEEVELLNEVARLERLLAGSLDDEARAAAEKELRDRRLELNVLLERARNQRRRNAY
jgi:hypothetical protein